MLQGMILMELLVWGTLVHCIPLRLFVGFKMLLILCFIFKYPYQKYYIKIQIRSTIAVINNILTLINVFNIKVIF